MKCRDLAELVTHYLENALPLQRRLSTRLHLAICSNCRRYVDQMRRTIRFLSEGPPKPPPAHEDAILAEMRMARGERDSRSESDFS